MNWEGMYIIVLLDSSIVVVVDMIVVVWFGFVFGFGIVF